MSGTGTWNWAFEQMKDGKRVSRGIEILGLDAGFLMEFGRRGGSLIGHAQLHEDDFNATNWMVVE